MCWQIKIARGRVSQGRESVRLGPGHNVNDMIARPVCSRVPAVGLISGWAAPPKEATATREGPPWHHDIYSIEDLAQLTSDLEQVNPRAAFVCRSSWWLKPGVGTVGGGGRQGLFRLITISG